MPTVLELMGLEIPAGLSGRSLLPFVSNPGMIDDDAAAVTTMYGSAAIRTNDYRYILYEDGSTELYDIAEDPNQWTNLAGDPAWQQVEEQLDGRLRADLEPQGWLWADAGESVVGSAGNDVLVLAPGTVSARGGGGDDVYFINDLGVKLVEGVGRGIDTVHVGDSYTLPDNIENVQLRYRVRGETLIGNALDNDMVGAGRLEGLEGDDRLELRGAGSADGGAGDDLLEGVGGADRLAGGDGNDVIVARGGNDLVGGGAGDDRIGGGDGIDTASYVAAASGVIVRLAIAGAQDTRGAGIDTLTGFENVTGSAFGDRLAGDGGANLLIGGAGSDMLDGGRAIDIMNGGAGNDVFIARDAGDAVIEAGNGGSDEVRSFVNYRLADNVETLRLYGAGRNGTGNDLANSITGTSGHNGLAGLGGNDLLRGGAGTDQLRGGDGNDRLDGGAGTDSMLGGAGADRFVFEGSHVTGLRDEADSIGDFSRAQQDRIDLRAIDADAGAGGDQNFQFLGTGAFSGAAGELRVGTSETGRYVEGDVDGDKVADFFIQVSGTQPLVGTDFIL
jgi:Ca2+-binding RTX toxin-like protein